MKIYKRIIEHYGTSNQKIKAIEELSELTFEIARDLQGNAAPHKIAEELADVEIMLEQLKRIYENHYKVELWKEHKLNRMEVRLNEST